MSSMNDISPDDPANKPAGPGIPVANVRTSPQPGQHPIRSSHFWLVTAASLFVAIGLVIYSSGFNGLKITICFDNGHGIQPGDAIRFRGIDVGKVLSVELNEHFDGVTVQARLNPASAGLARKSSHFWIERPLLSATEVRGLDTLIGDGFIEVVPGPAAGPRQVQFNGLNSAPSGEIPEGSLEIILEAKVRGSLQRGAPVFYRGSQIGHIVSVALSADAATVDARTSVLPDFKQLVRTNSVFWETSGIDLSVGLSGLRVNVDTISSIVRGGVSMATPDTPGRTVSTGHRFGVQEDVDTEKLLRWQPRIQIGAPIELPDGSLPNLNRAVLRWKKNLLGISTTRQRKGWIVRLNPSKLLGPTDMFQSDPASEDQESNLEIDGRQITIRTDQLNVHGKISLYHLIDPEDKWTATVSENRVRSPSLPEDCWITSSSQEQAILLVASRVVTSKDTWLVDSSLDFGPDCHGRAVVATKDGCLIGILVDQLGERRIFPVPPMWTTSSEQK